MDFNLKSFVKSLFKNDLTKPIKKTIKHKIVDGDFMLKSQYNGIKSSTTGRPCRNSQLTEEIALDLLKNHSLGEELFAAIPKKYK